MRGAAGRIAPGGCFEAGVTIGAAFRSRPSYLPRWWPRGQGPHQGGPAPPRVLLMWTAGAKVLGDGTVAPPRVVVLPLGQVVFGPPQRGPAPGGVPPVGVRAGFDEGLHRRQGPRTDGVVERGTVAVQVRARSVNVRPRPDQP